MNLEFKNGFLFVAMGVGCLFAGHAFSDEMEEIKAAPLPEQAVRLLGALMVGAFFAGLIFFAALLGALAWELIL